jgi:hypothetical protein
MIATHTFLSAPAGMHRTLMTPPLFHEFHDGFAMRVASPDASEG